METTGDGSKGQYHLHDNENNWGKDWRGHFESSLLASTFKMASQQANGFPHGGDTTDQENCHCVSNLCLRYLWWRPSTQITGHIRWQTTIFTRRQLKCNCRNRQLTRYLYKYISQLTSRIWITTSIYIFATPPTLPIWLTRQHVLHFEHQEITVWFLAKVCAVCINCMAVTHYYQLRKETKLHISCKLYIGKPINHTEVNHKVIWGNHYWAINF